MKLCIRQRKFVIMDKQRIVIAKGTPRNRHLVALSNEKDKKRILYYNSEALARNAFTNAGFYGNHDPNNSNAPYDLEPVAVDLIIEGVE